MHLTLTNETIRHPKPTTLLKISEQTQQHAKVTHRSIVTPKTNTQIPTHNPTTKGPQPYRKRKQKLRKENKPATDALRKQFLN